MVPIKGSNLKIRPSWPFFRARPGARQRNLPSDAFALAQFGAFARQRSQQPIPSADSDTVWWSDGPDEPARADARSTEMQIVPLPAGSDT